MLNGECRSIEHSPFRFSRLLDSVEMPAVQHCSFHAARPAYAVCMNCRKTLCQECATQWDGIWHCAACLAAMRGATVRRSQWAGWITVALTSLILLFFSARVMVWSGALIAGLR